MCLMHTKALSNHAVHAVLVQKTVPALLASSMLRLVRPSKDRQEPVGLPAVPHSTGNVPDSLLLYSSRYFIYGKA